MAQSHSHPADASAGGDGTDTKSFVRRLNREYEALHTKKEDAFWVSYMGLADDVDAARAAHTASENELKAFLGDPATLAEVCRRLDEFAEPSSIDDTQVALRGWQRTFEAHVIQNDEARTLTRELVEDEASLAKARSELNLSYEDKDRGTVEASSVELSVRLANDPDVNVRRSSWESLRRVEEHVLQHGFVELVKKRNRLGRLLGGEDFYDATVQRTEGMTKDEVFALLDDLEEKTRDAAHRSLDDLSRRHGDLHPWDVRFLVAGDVSAQLDPYFPFGRALSRWGRSFAAMGIDYRGATLALDLVDRKGKYENGFMHGPVPAWREHGTFRPARIHFTANAIPGIVGSGKRAAETLFHEGGHAAHFANNDMPAPCFAQEFAPSSVAFAETQSMFLDSLLSDGDWRVRYAKNANGESMPWSLIEKDIACSQPFAAWSVRSMLAVCYAEKAIYELPDSEVNASRILEVIRDAERRMLFLEEGSPRPVLSVPHLLSGESSAYYHGYVLAEMAVEQTRRHFLTRDGHIVDNPKVGPELRESYWKEGNLRRFDEFILRLTKTPISADALAERVNRTVEEATTAARTSVERSRDVPAFDGEVRLNAHIRVVHGNELIAEANGSGFSEMCDRFDEWVRAQEAVASS